MPNAEITIRLRAREDFVPVRSLLEVVNKTISILSDLNRRQAAKIPAEWKVSAASMQSPLSLTIGTDAPTGPVLVRECLSIFEEAEESPEMSRMWGERILQNAKDLVSVLENGVSQITFSSPGARSVSPTQRVSASVDYLISPAYEDYGTLEGSLETLSVHRKTRFSIFDPVTGRGIACFFESERLDEAHSAFNKRVAVSGAIRYSRLGDPLSIKVEHIRVLEGGIRAAELEGIDLTGGLDSVRYVRELRDA